ncbi:MAG TPA: orotidine-5'-phosphate decarboxylase [Anaerovoracaceae bacterium]|nr:orotidine-5'-phosphate decarboxylase [Anaerovoracaceae bacterium]
MGKDVIIALDFPTGKESLEFLDKFEEKLFVKVGMELFYSEGANIIKEIKKRGHKIFLDLKLHDIPNTVKKSMSILSELDIDMTNVHASGTKKMMKAALEGLGNKDIILIAVTQLTSTDQTTMENELLINETMDKVVLKYGNNAKEVGLKGVVCSPIEVPIIHSIIGDEFLTITPGVRLQGDLMGDQKRVTTPKMAKELGSDYIVVGRSITKADNPVMAYKKCVDEFIGEV